MDTSSPKAAKKEEPPRTSQRIQKKRKAEMDNLMEAAQAVGTNKVSSTAVDITPYLFRPLKEGNDGRGYVTEETRGEIKRAIKSTKRIVSADELHPVAKAMLESDKVKKDGVDHKSDRQRTDHFVSGNDYTITVNQGKPKIDARNANDTPPPRSPNPYNTDQALKSDLRYEKTHQSAYQFTRAPGTTVFAPTQANQAADTVHERHAAKKVGGFVFRHDTYDTTTMISGKPVGNNQYKLYESVYRRRANTEIKSNNNSDSS